MSSSSELIKSVALISFVCCTTNTRAAQQSNAEPAELGNAQPQKVEVVGASQEKLARSEALSRSVVTSEVLMRYGDATITDALKRLPGVLVINEQIQLIGLEGKYTQVLVDGQPPRGITVSELPLSNVDRVEIYRQGNAQFSAQAIGGTINIVLKKIQKTSQQQLRLNSAYSYRTSGSFDYLSSAKVGDSAHAISISAGETGALSSMPITTSTVVLDRSGNKYQQYRQEVDRDAENISVRVNPRGQYKISEDTNLSISSSISATKRSAVQREFYEFTVGPILPVPDFRQLSDSKNFLGNVSLQLSTGFQAGRKLELGVGGEFSHATNNAIEDAFDFTDNPIFERARYARSRTFGFNSTGKLTIPVGKIHEVTAGWDVSTKDSRWKRDERKIFGLSNYSPIDQRTNSKINKADFFVQDEWKLQESISAYVGGRMEYVSIRAEELDTPVSRNRFSFLSPVGQLLWQLNKDNTDRLRFGVSRTYQPPTDEQLLTPRWRNVNNTIQTPNLRGNSNLRPESSWALDVGFEHSGKRGLNLNVYAKYRKISDRITNVLSFDDGEWWLSYLNDGKAVSKSIEIESQFPLKAFYETKTDLNFSVGLSKTWSTAGNVDPPFNNISPIDVNASINVDYKAQKLPLGIGGGLRYTGTQWQRVNSIKLQYFEMPLDLSTYVSWRFNNNVQLRLALDNLLKGRFVIRSVNASDSFTTFYTFRNSAYRRAALNLEIKF